jgi:nucleotide-binding universal stress UspA family protein
MGTLVVLVCRNYLQHVFPNFKEIRHELRAFDNGQVRQLMVVDHENHQGDSIPFDTGDRGRNTHFAVGDPTRSIAGRNVETSRVSIPTMGKRVLLPIDGKDHAQESYTLASELFPDGTFVLLHVVNPADASFSIDGTMPSFPDGWYEQQKSHAKAAFDALETQASEDGIETESVVELGKPVRKILETIDAEDIDHVVMGCHGRQGVSRLLLGSTAESVIRCSSVPVTVA